MPRHNRGRRRTHTDLPPLPSDVLELLERRAAAGEPFRCWITADGQVLDDVDGRPPC